MTRETNLLWYFWTGHPRLVWSPDAASMVVMEIPGPQQQRRRRRGPNTTDNGDDEGHNAESDSK